MVSLSPSLAISFPRSLFLPLGTSWNGREGAFSLLWGRPHMTPLQGWESKTLQKRGWNPKEGCWRSPKRMGGRSGKRLKRGGRVALPFFRRKKNSNFAVVKWRNEGACERNLRNGGGEEGKFWGVQIRDWGLQRAEMASSSIQCTELMYVVL